MKNTCRSNVLLRGIGICTVAIAAMLLCIATILTPLILPNSANAATNTDSHTVLHSSRNFSGKLTLAEGDESKNPYVNYDNWTQAAKRIEESVTKAVQHYADKQFAGAQAELRSTYNLVFVASNFVTAARQYLGSDKQMPISEAFQKLQSLSLQPNQVDALRKQAQHVAALVLQAGQALDGNTQVLKPRAYAEQLAQKVAKERKEIQSKSTLKREVNTRTWLQIAQAMNDLLDKSVQLAQSGDIQKAVDTINDAYYKNYERYGFEKNVSNAIGSARVSVVESQFKDIKNDIRQKTPINTIRQSVDVLKGMLLEDAKKLDGSEGHASDPITHFITSSFGQSFIILIREGLEALLVVAAIIAYLVKSGNKHLIRWIYLGVVAGLVASGLVALLFNILFSGNGPQQENLEGIVALIAMFMLLYTSNWMLSKSDAQAWQGYIQNKTEQAILHVGKTKTVSLATACSLAMLSFLAVFREGAETVLFYESIYALTQDTQGMILGAAAAAVLLIIIFLIIRFTSVHIPLKPFFVVTSVLMAVLVIAFAGGGVHSLIEGDLLQGIYLQNFPTNEWLGLYPFVETIVAQIIAVLLVIGTFGYAFVRNKKRSAEHQISES